MHTKELATKVSVVGMGGCSISFSVVENVIAHDSFLYLLNFVVCKRGYTVIVTVTWLVHSLF